MAASAAYPHPEEILEWATKEMEYRPLEQTADDFPLDADSFKKICRGNLAPVWKFLVERVRSYAPKPHRKFAIFCMVTCIYFLFSDHQNQLWWQVCLLLFGVYQPERFIDGLMVHCFERRSWYFCLGSSLFTLESAPNETDLALPFQV